MGSSSIGIIFVLLSLSAFFSCMEAVFISMDRVTVRRFQNSDGLLEKVISGYLRNLDSFLVSTLLSNLIINTAVVWYTQDLLQGFRFFSQHRQVENVFLILLQSLCLLMICDIVPKRFGVRYSQFFSYGGSIPMLIFYGLTYPFSRAMLIVKNRIEKIVRKNHNSSIVVRDEYEILEYIRSSHERGVLGESEGNILYNLVAYRDAFVDSVLIPRMKMEGFNIDQLPTNLYKKVLQFPYEVIPVYKGVTDNIVGILDKRKIFLKGNIKNLKADTLKKYLDPPRIVTNSLGLVEGFLQMYETGTKLCVVVDEYGGVAGIVTYKDISSLLLGQSSEIGKSFFQLQNEGSYRVEGSTDLVYFNKMFETSLHSHKAHTVGGYILELVGDIPAKGATFEIEGISLCVEEVTKRGIQLLKVQRKTT